MRLKQKLTDKQYERIAKQAADKTPKTQRTGNYYERVDNPNNTNKRTKYYKYQSKFKGSNNTQFTPQATILGAFVQTTLNKLFGRVM